MMAILQDWYLGDSALASLVVVAIGVAVLSAGAWLIALRLPRNPAVRHLILFWAIVGCLGMPALACLVRALGWTLLEIPVVAAPSTPAPQDARVGHLALTGAQSAGTGITTPMGPDQEVLSGLTRTYEAAKSSTPPTKAAATPSVVPPGQSVPVITMEGRTWAGSYREVATGLLLIWATGTVFLLARLARCCLQVARLRRSSALATDRRLLSLMARFDVAQGRSRLPDLRISREIAAPLAAGFWNPAIFLPDRLLGAVTDDELYDILLHELAHVRRSDPQAVLAQEIARALYWPIVTIHPAIAELARAREELCDNHVLQSRDALDYGQTLLHLAELTIRGRPSPTAAAQRRPSPCCRPCC